MPLPPEFLKLKRKRHEELPDTLFVQKEHRNPKRSFTDTAWQFRRVSIDRPPSSSARPGSLAAHHQPDSKYAPRVPSVRATLPGEEDLKTQSKEHYQHNGAPKPNYDRSSALFQDAPTQSRASQVDRRRLGPRRFHLTTASILYSHQVQASKGGILKHKKGLHENLPIFSERTKEYLSTMLLDKVSASHSEEGLQVTAQHAEATLEETEPPLKRPNASAAEKQWRAQNWQKSVQRPTAEEAQVRSQAEEEFLATQREYETLKLAAELQKFAIKQTYRDALSGNLERQAKVKPKPQLTRHAHGQSDHNLSDYHATERTQEDECEWIIETYVRKANPAPANDAEVNVMCSDKPPVDFGLLVIPEEDEPAWEIFGEDEGIDSDDGSDSSDSNAEDYYANDYPEDEVNSDDEYGRGAYRYRHADSDDEEYDEAAVSYSDEEDTKPWKRGLWAGGDANTDDHKRGAAGPVVT
ncbi:hypothetical protein MMC18_002975 [Xylographa bjoerkii]|nr:hypothetical protein [Xylographa bjoerkii]